MNQSVLAARRWQYLYPESWYPAEAWRQRAMTHDEFSAHARAHEAGTKRRYASYVNRQFPIDIWPMTVDPDNRRLVRYPY